MLDALRADGFFTPWARFRRRVGFIAGGILALLGLPAGAWKPFQAPRNVAAIVRAAWKRAGAGAAFRALLMCVGAVCRGAYVAHAPDGGFRGYPPPSRVRGGPLARSRKTCPAYSPNEATDEGKARAKRRQRFALREISWKHHPRPRPQKCGRLPIKGRFPETRQRANGEAYFAGVGVCGSGSCPVCQPKIRQGRAEEIERGGDRWLKDGGSLAFLTLTFPHDHGESLKELLETIRKAFTKTLSGRPWREDRERFRVVHWVRAYDLTHGSNGWHPHFHGLLFIEGNPTAAELRALEDSLSDRWARFIAAQGRRLPSRERGVRLELARSVAELAGYLAKIKGEETGARVSFEIARGDLKSVRKGGRTPGALLGDFRDTGDVEDLELWREYAEAIHGRHWIRWSKGARAALRVEERTDEELAAEGERAEDATVFRHGPEEWQALRGTPGALGALLDILETEGIEAADRFRRGIRQRFWERRRRAWTRPVNAGLLYGEAA